MAYVECLGIQPLQTEIQSASYPLQLAKEPFAQTGERALHLECVNSNLMCG